MDEVERRLGTLTKSKKEPIEKGQKILDSYDDGQRAEVQERGTAILGALKKGKEQSTSDIDYHHLAGAMAAYGGGRKPYLVNPFTLVHFPESYYEDLFGVDVDPELIIPILKIWRIEKFIPVEVDSSVWGQFHTRDSYLLLWITDKEEKQVINVHHWIGKESTPDKYGACAIRAIELNVRLGGQCRIYREVEGEESDLFVSYFEDDLEYLFGGSETAFRKVEEMIWEPRLYQICRLVDRQDPHKENEFYVQKVEMVGDILTHDDVYVLDMGKKIFQFNGKNADIVHRHFATQFCYQVNYYDHRGQSTRILLEDDEALDSDEKVYDWGVFWNCLGGEVELPHSEKVVPFGLAVNAVSVSVVGSWHLPKVGEMEELDEGKESETEMQAQEREEENELRMERNELREKRKKIFSRYTWNPETRETTIPLQEVRPGIFSTKALLPFGIYTYRYQIEERDGRTDWRIDKKRSVKKTITGDKFNRIHISDQDIPEPIMYRIATTSSGQIDVEELEVDVLDLTRKMLKNEYVYILDCDSETFVWMGKRSLPGHRKVGMAIARKLMDEMDRPAHADIAPQVVYSGAETPTFQYKFSDWNRTLQIFCRNFAPKVTPGFELEHPNGGIPIDELAKDEVRECDDREWQDALEEFGDSKPQVWVLNGRGPKLEKLTAQEAGQFHDGNCYLVLLSYNDANDHNRQKFIAYFWEGVNANGRSRWPEFLKGFFHPVLEKKVGKGRVRAERVPQYKEPASFMVLFDGEIVIRSGQRSALRRKILRQDALFKVSATRLGRAHIAQISQKNLELHSNTCYVMQTEGKMFVWKGAKANDDETKRAQNFANSYKNDRPVIEIEEGVETDEFWEAVGGSSESLAKHSTDDSKSQFIRLFRCSCDKGYFSVERIPDFCQSDFDHSSAFVLDGYYKVFLWVGVEASRNVEAGVTSFVKDYVAKVAELRGIDVEIETQEINKESISFRKHFPAWEERVLGPAWEGNDPYDVSKKRVVDMRNDDILAGLRKDKEIGQKAFLTRIRQQSEAGVKSELVTVDFRKELEKAGIHLPDEKTLKKKESAKTQQGWTKFEYNVKKEDEYPLVVQVLGSWDNYKEAVTMYPAPSPIGDPEKIVATFVTSLDLVVGRYYYYYKVARESEGVVKDVDEEHATSERDGIKMNNRRVRAEGRVNGEEEQQAWDEQERAKLDSVLEVKEEFEEKEEEKEEEEEDEEKERKMRSLNEEEAELARQVEEKLARRREREEEKKRKEQEERKARRQEKEIEEKMQNRRNRGEPQEEKRNWRDRFKDENDSSSSSSSSSGSAPRLKRDSSRGVEDESIEARRERRRKEREAAREAAAKEEEGEGERRRRDRDVSSTGDDLAERRRQREREREKRRAEEGAGERRRDRTVDTEVDFSSMSIEERRELRRKRREGLI